MKKIISIITVAVFALSAYAVPTDVEKTAVTDIVKSYTAIQTAAVFDALYADNADTIAPVGSWAVSDLVNYKAWITTLGSPLAVNTNALITRYWKATVPEAERTDLQDVALGWGQIFIPKYGADAEKYAALKAAGWVLDGLKLQPHIVIQLASKQHDIETLQAFDAVTIASSGVTSYIRALGSALEATGATLEAKKTAWSGLVEKLAPYKSSASVSAAWDNLITLQDTSFVNYTRSLNEAKLKAQVQAAGGQ